MTMKKSHPCVATSTELDESLVLRSMMAKTSLSISYFGYYRTWILCCFKGTSTSRLWGFCGRIRHCLRFCRLDLTVDDELQLGLDKLEVVCFIKKYDRATMSNTGTPGLRYSVVKTYAVSALEPLPALPAASSNSTSEEGTSEDKQPFTPRTVKNMTEIEGVTKPTRSDYPSPPAKRGLDFISAEIDKVNTSTLPENADTDEKVARDDLQLPGDSSVKQSRGKLKLS